MSKTIEFFFDFGSPTTYLANTQLTKLAHGQCQPSDGAGQGPLDGR